MITGIQAHHALEKSVAYEVEKMRVASLLEQHARALTSLQTTAKGESEKLDALAAAKPRDVVARGLEILMEESDSPENPLSIGHAIVCRFTHRISDSGSVSTEGKLAASQSYSTVVSRNV